MTSLDTTGALLAVPDSVKHLSADAAAMILDGSLDAAWANRSMCELATSDVAHACLLWRNVTNLARLATRPHLRHVVEDVESGGLVATVFSPARTRATVSATEVRIEGARLMTTGAGYARWFLVEAKAAGDCPLLAVVERHQVVAVERPQLLGLMAADNAYVTIAARVPLTAVVADAEETSMLVALPYELGLTLGAVGVGAAHATLALGPPPESLDEDQMLRGGAVRAQVAAAHALVQQAPARAPRAALTSKAAKLAAVSAAHATCAWTRHLLGAATYESSHPLNRLEGDIRGLVHQAPTNRSAAAALVHGLPDDNPKEKVR